MTPRAFVLDANVLYSARLRDLWLQLHAAGVARVLWTETIESEWTAALLRARPELRVLVERTVQVLRARFPDAYIPDSDLKPLSVVLPDPADLHVLRAAIAAGAVIVTHNLQDFPAPALASAGAEALSPDDALTTLAAHDEDGVLAAAAAVRARLVNPPMAAEAFARGFEKAGCPRLAAWLLQRAHHL